MCVRRSCMQYVQYHEYFFKLVKRWPIGVEEANNVLKNYQEHFFLETKRELYSARAGRVLVNAQVREPPRRFQVLLVI